MIDTDWARTWSSRVVRSLAMRVVFRPFRTLFAPTRVHHRELLAQLKGPAVFVSNHTSHADTLILTTALPRRVRRRVVVAAAADYFFSKTSTARMTALLVGAIPVDRNKVSRATLELCHRLLGEGWSLIIFPEGGRSPDGTLQPFKPGAAWIARRAGVPVVPVHLDGVYHVLPKGQRRPKRHHVDLTFGVPMMVGVDEGAREFNARIEAAVQELADARSASASIHPIDERAQHSQSDEFGPSATDGATDAAEADEAS